MAAKPEKNPFFSIDNTGTQVADLHGFFLSEKGKRELRETARATAPLKLKGAPDDESMSLDIQTDQQHR